MEELAIIKRLTNRANEKLMTEKLWKVLERFGYKTLTTLTTIEYWEWELILEKFKRNSKYTMVATFYSTALDDTRLNLHSKGLSAN